MTAPELTLRKVAEPVRLAEEEMSRLADRLIFVVHDMAALRDTIQLVHEQRLREITGGFA